MKLNIHLNIDIEIWINFISRNMWAFNQLQCCNWLIHRSANLFFPILLQFYERSISLWLICSCRRLNEPASVSKQENPNHSLMCNIPSTSAQKYILNSSDHAVCTLLSSLNILLCEKWALNAALFVWKVQTEIEATSPEEFEIEVNFLVIWSLSCFS